MWELKFWFYTNFYSFFNFFLIFQDLIFKDYFYSNFSFYSFIFFNFFSNSNEIVLANYSLDLSSSGISLDKLYLQRYNVFSSYNIKYPNFFFNNSFLFKYYFSSSFTFKTQDLPLNFSLPLFSNFNLIVPRSSFDFFFKSHFFYLDEIFLKDFQLFFSFDSFRNSCYHNFIDKAVFFKQVWPNFYDNEYFIRSLFFNNSLENPKTSMLSNSRLSSFFLDLNSFYNSNDINFFYLFMADKNIDTYCLKNSYHSLFYNIGSFNQFFVQENFMSIDFEKKVLNIFFLSDFIYDYYNHSFSNEFSSNSFFLFDKRIFDWFLYSSDSFKYNLKNPWKIYNFIIFYFFFFYFFPFFFFPFTFIFKFFLVISSKKICVMVSFFNFIIFKKTIL